MYGLRIIDTKSAGKKATVKQHRIRKVVRGEMVVD